MSDKESIDEDIAKLSKMIKMNASMSFFGVCFGLVGLGCGLISLRLMQSIGVMCISLVVGALVGLVVAKKIDS